MDTTPPGLEPDLNVTSVTSQLLSLQERQERLLQELRDRNLASRHLVDRVEDVFKQVPAYVAKLNDTQQLMVTIASRTADMRTRCAALEVIESEDAHERQR